MPTWSRAVANGFAEDSSAALTMAGISKAYGAVRALRDVSLTVRQGTIHAIVGANGAGKSTLIECIAGTVTPDAGRIWIAGKTATITNPLDARRHGIAVVHQHLSLAPNMSVAENLFLAREPVRLGFVNSSQLVSDAQRLLDRHELAVDARVLVGVLPTGVQQQIEILRALSMNARIIALDEPTSSLSVFESRQLFAQLERIRQTGTAIVVVTHHIADVVDVAVEGTVLRDGAVAGTFSVDTSSQEDIVRLMLGRAVDALQRTDEARVVQVGNDRSGLKVTNVHSGTQARGISLKVDRGEVVGLYGLVGAGRSELLEIVFGLRRLETGSIQVDGLRLEPNHTASQAIRAGLTLLPEDRITQGLFANRSVAENITVPRLRQFGRFFLRSRDIKEEGAAVIRRFEIKGLPDDRVSTLSGGNQQKVLFARSVSASPVVLLLDEPTRGVDVGTKALIHRAIRRVASEENKAVLMVSSEWEEILAVSDRIYCMADGRIVDECLRENASQDRLLTNASRIRHWEWSTDAGRSA